MRGASVRTGIAGKVTTEDKGDDELKTRAVLDGSSDIFSGLPFW